MHCTSLLLSLLLSSTLSAQVNFKDFEWQQAKDSARQQNKNLFVDCYTNWCGWCRVMDKKP